jgi:hypothetical protein
MGVAAAVDDVVDATTAVVGVGAAGVVATSVESPLQAAMAITAANATVYRRPNFKGLPRPGAELPAKR